jgi:hypothetical protein
VIERLKAAACSSSEAPSTRFRIAVSESLRQLEDARAGEPGPATDLQLESQALPSLLNCKAGVKRIPGGDPSSHSVRA